MSQLNIHSLIEAIAAVNQQVGRLLRQIPSDNQNNFVIPNSDELEFLLQNNDSYQEYSLALAWIEDILLNYTERLIRPSLGPEEAKHRYFEVLRQPENELLAENLSINFANAIRLSQIAQDDKELGSILIGAFLDDMTNWLNHFRESVRTGDKTLIREYQSRNMEAIESLDEVILSGKGTPPSDSKKASKSEQKKVG
jgi:hypothetical protein